MKREEVDHEEGNVRRLLRQTEAAPRMSGEARERVLEQLLASQARRASRPGLLRRLAPRVTPRRAGAALGVLALAAGAALMLRTAAPVDGPRVYENLGPGPKAIALSDGTQVVLDVGAKLVERGARRVLLERGQAIFDVKGRAGRFDLELPQGRASAEGTRFLASNGAQGATIAVAKGRVSVANALGQTGLLHAGEQSVLSTSAAPSAEAAPRVSHLFAFARATEAPASPNAPRKKGTLVGRDPRWSTEEPLDLRGFEVDVHVEDGVARTTVDQTYFNPRSRQLEGIYAFPVPEGAALSRLAMYVDGSLMEGAIVERDRGRDIYEGIVEARRDPALLEWMSGNTFRMRVFPLPARSEKRIFMSYTRPLEHLYGVDRLTVPIPNVDQRAASVRFNVRVVGGADMVIASPSHEVSRAVDGKDAVVSLEARDQEIGQDLVLTMEPRSKVSDVARSFEDGDGRYVMVRHEPDVRAIARAEAGEGPLRRQGPRRVAVLFDVSASRGAEDLDAQARFVDGLIDSLDEEDEVAFVTVGYQADVMPGGLVPVGQLDRDRVGAFLSARAEGVGSTRIDLALKRAVDLVEGATGEREIVYIGDGVVSAPSALGGPSTPDLASIVRGRGRFLGVAIGDSVDHGLLGSLADATDGWVIDVGEEEDLAHRAFDLVASTYTPCITGLAADVVGADGKPIEGAIAVPVSRRLCDGERLDVVARAAKTGAAPYAMKVRGRMGAESWERELPLSGAGAGAAYLPRLFAERRVASLLAHEPPGPGRAESPNAKEITALAKRHFLVTPFTSLLVLENDAMYKEFGVEKKNAEGWALYAAPERIDVKVESLAVTAGASASWDLVERSPLQLFYDHRGSSGDLGGLGLIGTIGHGDFRNLRLSGRGEGGGGRGQGFGSGSGRLGGAHRERADVPRKVTTRSLLSEGAKKRRGPSVMTGAEARTVAASDSLDALLPMAQVAAGGAVGRETDWLASAFAGEQLMRYRYAADDSLSDLTAHVPSLFALDVDSIADLVAVRSQPGFVDEAAKVRLAAARAAAPVFVTAERGSFEVRAGGVTLSRTLPTSLVEVGALEGGALSFEYEQLGLKTTRDIGGASAWWLASEAPWVPPVAASLEGLVVEPMGTNGVRVRAPRSAGSAVLPDLELTFDGQGRVSVVAHVRGAERLETTLRYLGEVVEVTRPAGQVEVYRVASKGSVARASSPLVEVEMPLSNPGRWTEIADDPSSPTAEVSRAHRQLLATYAALEDDSKLAAHLAALKKAAGRLERGDVALASGAFRSYRDLRQLLEDLPKTDGVQAYLRALSAPAPAKPLDEAAKDHGGTLVGMMAMFSGVLVEAGRTGATKAVVSRVSALNREYPEARFFRYAAVRTAADHLGWQEDGRLAVKLWDTLSSDHVLKPIADRQIASRLQYGDDKEAAARALLAMDGAIARGIPFTVDWSLSYAISRGRGSAALDLAISRWRRAISERGTARQVLGLVRTLTDPYGPMRGASADLSGALRRLSDAPDTDESVRISIAAQLLNGGRVAEAKQVVSPLLEGPSPRPIALELSVLLAEKEGDLERAARELDRLIVVTEGDSLDLSIVREWYRSLVQLHMRRAGLTTGNAADHAIEQALGVAARWRKEDPDNVEIDEQVATSLFAMGRPDDAKRHLSSIVERRPAEGIAWSRVATVLQREGELDGALETWSEAVRVEPTNPTWLLSQAEALLARGASGDKEQARSLLSKIQDGKWQDRFQNVRYEAQRALDGAR